MDIYQRVCKRINFVLDNPETTEDVPPTEETEYYEEEFEEEELEKVDCYAVKRELECLKRRIQKLQLRLKIGDTDVCPEEECMDYEVLLSCSENKEICALQKNNHKLQCQINELVRCCNVAKEQLRDLRERLCQQSKDIKQLKEIAIEMIDFRNTLELEFGVCIERFQYLKTVKAEWNEVAEVLHKERKKFYKLESNYITKQCYSLEMEKQNKVIAELKEVVRQLAKRPQIAVKMCQKPPKECRKKKYPLNKHFPMCIDAAIVKDKKPRSLLC